MACPLSFLTSPENNVISTCICMGVGRLVSVRGIRIVCEFTTIQAVLLVSALPPALNDKSYL